MTQQSAGLMIPGEADTEKAQVKSSVEKDNSDSTTAVEAKTEF